MTEPDFTPAALEAAGALTPAPDPGYQWPTDPLIRQNLEHWQDLKVGVIIHWGIYSYIGQGGSWSLHREDLGWFTDPPAAWQGSDADYQTWYYDQARYFTGENFDAAQWAQACAGAGMKYLVFTTKHHDGFAMFNTEYSNCKSTAEDAGLGRDIFAEVTQAFRAEGLETGVYFSKADWHHPAYWDRAKPITNRFHNYDIARLPKKWDQFVRFNHAQIEELLSNYGPMNVLWLDAGWVRAPQEPWDIDAMVARARELQPGILVVDREVHGPYEDYRTPEQQMPSEVLEYPWESCITMTKEWCSLRPDEPAKPTSEIVANLVQIVARGGNYLLGIGPDATGAMPPDVARGLSELGQWLDACGEGIYGSRAVPADSETKLEIEAAPESYRWFPTQKDGYLYLYGLPATPESLLSPTAVSIKAPLKSAAFLGGGSVEFTTDGDWTRLQLPAAPTPWACALRLEVVSN